VSLSVLGLARVLQSLDQAHPQFTNGAAMPITALAHGNTLRRTRCHARFFELASRARLFTASGAVGGVTHGTAFGTTSPIALCNPVGSHVAAVVSHVAIGYVSGTLGLGEYLWGQATQATVIAGALTTTQGQPMVGTQCRGAAACNAYSNTALTGTPTLLRPSGLVYTPMLATTVQLSVAMREQIEGAFIVLPGSRIVLQGVGSAGTTPLLVHSISWYEVPLGMVSSPLAKE
jgi:hypothetical protein